MNKLDSVFKAFNEVRSQLLTKYFMVGVFNTAFGYLATILLYYSLEHNFHIVIILIIANVLSITVSFFTYKFFVFKSTNFWFFEYLRSYAVYGTSIIIGLVGVWALVDVMGVPFWLAQTGLLIVSVSVSFFGHKNFTFKEKDGSKKIN
jgi:putative flippase GtrA